MDALSDRPLFQYFGGKCLVAHRVWRLFGDPECYVEPFFGSGAVLLARETPCSIEIVNDLDGYVANFWRAVQAEPDAVARWADWPINECDLTARHHWLTSSETVAAWRPRLLADPTYYDPQIAGWWMWGLRQWIGGGWCDGRVYRKRPKLIKSAGGVDLKRPAALVSARLRYVRVCCGDWSRVVTDSVVATGRVTAVFLDPPYSAEAGCDPNIYNHDDLTVAHAVAAWARDHGDDPTLRIVLCGHDGEHTMPSSWRVIPWNRPPGYAALGNSPRRENRFRERLWVSPHCLPDGLFDRPEAAEEVAP